MTDRRADVFFYGLFMDRVLLEEQQVQPVNPRRGYVDGFALRIARRATLVPRSGARAYGVVFGLTHGELDRLYSAPGLEQYRPEAILVQVPEGKPVPALCYTLPAEPPPEERNAEYATRLRAVLAKLEFPAEYADSVA